MEIGGTVALNKGVPAFLERKKSILLQMIVHSERLSLILTHMWAGRLDTVCFTPRSVRTPQHYPHI